MKKKRSPILSALIILIAVALILFNRAGSSSEPPSEPASSAVTTQDPSSETEDPDSGDIDEPDIGEADDPDINDIDEPSIDENGTYTSRDEVALYLHTYGHLPSNYLTKKEAKELGWKSSGGTLDKVAPGMSIGGDRFGNREGLLPEGHTWYECDIDYVKGSRNSKRILYSDDGLIYYTDDHYSSFTQLY